MRACGTRSKYQTGCRCEPCRQANREYQGRYEVATARQATYRVPIAKFPPIALPKP